MLRTRRSIREFQDKPVPNAVVEQVLEAARTAPSAHNYQKTQYVIVQRVATRKRLFDLLAAFYAGLARQVNNPIVRAVSPFSDIVENRAGGRCPVALGLRHDRQACAAGRGSLPPRRAVHHCRARGTRPELSGIQRRHCVTQRDTHGAGARAGWFPHRLPRRCLRARPAFRETPRAPRPLTGCMEPWRWAIPSAPTRAGSGARRSLQNGCDVNYFRPASILLARRLATRSMSGGWVARYSPAMPTLCPEVP